MEIKFEIDENVSKELMATLSLLPNRGEEIVNEVLHGEGSEILKSGITELIHPSGRTWEKKKKASKIAKPFRTINSNLSVTIYARSGYEYLYFPDDGSNTRRHAGRQHFMLKGTQNQSGKVIDMCLLKLNKAIDG